MSGVATGNFGAAVGGLLKDIFGGSDGPPKLSDIKKDIGNINKYKDQMDSDSQNKYKKALNSLQKDVKSGLDDQDPYTYVGQLQNALGDLDTSDIDKLIQSAAGTE